MGEELTAQIANQIKNIVQNLSKKNFRTSLTELEKVSCFEVTF